MIKKIIRPATNTYVLHLPDDMVGKTIEILAFEIEDDAQLTAEPDNSNEERLKSVRESYKKYPPGAYQAGNEEARDDERDEHRRYTADSDEEPND
jgi:hypothetical protein